MTVEGVDFSFSRPGGAALVAAGKHFVCRYLAYRDAPRGALGKFLTADEVADYHRHGIAIVANLESTANRALDGNDAGRRDAQDAKNALHALGAPDDLPVYFSVDFDASAGQQLAINRYLQGAATVMDKQRVGVYGGFDVVSRCLASGFVSWAWQTYAWSGGRISSKAHLYQYRNGQSIGGSAVDFDRALRSPFGAWIAPGLPDTATASQEDARMGLIQTPGEAMEIRDVPKGTPLFDDPHGLDSQKVTAMSQTATLAYVGLVPGLSTYAVRFSSAAEDPQHEVEAVIGWVRRADVSAPVRAAAQQTAAISVKQVTVTLSDGHTAVLTA
ncbi:MAG TPA: DUF1906 domain-containing protein [Candidatus Limnocylindrales bacterium]|nr:DUF1906 domain-containing protein [Candidatus Limnocylindrales bacterium]